MRVAEYFKNETISLLNRYKNIEALIPKVKARKDSGIIPEGSYHTAEEGRFLEEILRDLLNKHLPKDLRAISGFILRPVANVGEGDTRRDRDQEKDLHSTQIDILIFDVGKYPMFESFSDFAIVPPEGVIGIISVKKNLYKSQVESELKSLKYASSLCWHYNYNEDQNGCKTNKDKYNEYVIGPVTALIAYNTNEEKIEESIVDYIEDIYRECPVDGYIKQVSVINKFSFLRGKERIKDDTYRVPFLKFNHKKREDYAIQRLIHSLLETYYHRTRSSLIVSPGYNNYKDQEALLEKEFSKEFYANKKELNLDFMLNNSKYLEEDK